ncbi:acyl carrier protein [Herbaspirillum huttiense]|uniref:acyl carrier protein n=1 Tax=Herbaspirillum huttiense TaxID=863372 RepID=UPI003B3A039D
MKHQNVEWRVRTVVAFWLHTDVEKVQEDTRFEEDLDADSLDCIEVIMGLEDEFEIEISDDDADKIKTVRQAIDYVKGL